jgi:hypothetical protein
VLRKKSYRTPGTSRFKVIHPDKHSELIDLEYQSRYYSGVGMLLYLTKYSRPDCCKVLRELCKCMDGVTMGTYLELLRVTELFLDTKIFCLKIQAKFENKNWNLNIFCRSDWAGDPETVTGFIAYLMNVPVYWRSTAQRGVTLLSSEAKYVAISKSFKEIRFMNFLLCDFGIDVEIPIVVKTDNIGALFMAQNVLTQTSRGYLASLHKIKN